MGKSRRATSVISRRPRVPERFNVANQIARDALFNKPVARYARKFVNKFPKSKFSSISIEAGRCGTIRALLAKKIVFRRAIAYTANPGDYKKLCKARLNVEKMQAMSHEIYARSMELGGKNVIVAHDGHQNGLAVLRDMKILLEQGHKRIGLACNLTTRCGKFSHKIFAARVIHLAETYRYHVKHRKIAPYSRMRPFWFDLEKIKCINLAEE